MTTKALADVLGVSRLDYTIRAGLICSKTEGGRNAHQEFGARWYPILNEYLADPTQRARALAVWGPIARRRDALAFVKMVINDSTRR